MRESTTRQLKTGRYSKEFNDFLRNKGLPTMDDIKRLPVETPAMITEKIALMEDYNRRIQPMVELYGSATGRGLRAIDKLADIRQKILVREDKLRLDGVDALEDNNLLMWHRLELDLIKHLEKLKFDTAKATIDYSLKKKQFDDEELTLRDVREVKE